MMTSMATPERPLLETTGYVDWSFNLENTVVLSSEQWLDTVAAQNGWHG